MITIHYPLQFRSSRQGICHDFRERGEMKLILLSSTTCHYLLSTYQSLSIHSAFNDCAREVNFPSPWNIDDSSQKTPRQIAISISRRRRSQNSSGLNRVSSFDNPGPCRCLLSLTLTFSPLSSLMHNLADSSFS